VGALVAVILGFYITFVIGEFFFFLFNKNTTYPFARDWPLLQLCYLRRMFWRELDKSAACGTHTSIVLKPLLRAFFFDGGAGVW
jgi:hypothetical protein